MGRRHPDRRRALWRVVHLAGRPADLRRDVYHRPARRRAPGNREIGRPGFQKRRDQSGSIGCQEPDHPVDPGRCQRRASRDRIARHAGWHHQPGTGSDDTVRAVRHWRLAGGIVFVGTDQRNRLHGLRQDPDLSPSGVPVHVDGSGSVAAMEKHRDHRGGDTARCKRLPGRIDLRYFRRKGVLGDPDLHHAVGDHAVGARHHPRLSDFSASAVGANF